MIVFHGSYFFFSINPEVVAKNWHCIDQIAEWGGCSGLPPVYKKIFLNMFQDAFYIDYAAFRNKRYEVLNDDEFKVTEIGGDVTDEGVNA